MARVWWVRLGGVPGFGSPVRVFAGAFGGSSWVLLVVSAAGRGARAPTSPLPGLFVAKYWLHQPQAVLLESSLAIELGLGASPPPIAGPGGTGPCHGPRSGTEGAR